MPCVCRTGLRRFNERGGSNKRARASRNGRADSRVGESSTVGSNRTVCRNRGSERCPCKRLPGSEPAIRKICGVATANGVDLTRKSRRTKREIANSRQKARSFPISRVVPNEFYFLLIVWGVVALHFFRFDPKRRRSYFPLSCWSVQPPAVTSPRGKNDTNACIQHFRTRVPRASVRLARSRVMQLRKTIWRMLS